MGDGAITLWDVKKILAKGDQAFNPVDPSQAIKMGLGCVSAVNIHSNVPVTAIEFNPHKKNLLASGGAEVFI